MRHLVISTTLAGLLACSTGEPGAPRGGDVPSQPSLATTPTASRAGSRTGICGEGDDIVLDAFCGDTKPTSLLELRERLGLHDVKKWDDTYRAPVFGTVTSSTSLAVRTISEANPRVILHGFDRNGVGHVFLAFARGTAAVELSAEDRKTRELTFYLVRFDVAGSLLLPSVESGWTNVTLTRDIELEDTPQDCLGCHRPEGPSGKKRYVMREDESPWMHWMGRNTFTPGMRSFFCDDKGGTVDCARASAEASEYNPYDQKDPGVAVADAFTTVHATNATYGSVAVADLVEHHIDYVMMDIVRGGYSPERQFPGFAVFTEVNASAPAQPFVNVPSGASPTWSAARTKALRAPVALPFPYQDAKASDPAALERYAATYHDVLANKAPASALDAASDLLLPAAKRALLIEMEPDLSGEDVLHRACTQCHNDRVRPELHRARFDASNLSKNSRAERDLAIARMRLPASDPRRMPPAVFRDLDDASIRAAVATLERQ